MYNELSNNEIRELKQIVGENNVVTEKEKMEDYSHDEFALTDIRKYPEAVVKPQNTEQISKVMKLANENNFAVTPRGAATGLCGGCVPVFGGIVLSLEKMNRVVEIDKDNLMAVVEPGAMLLDFYPKVKEAGLFFPPHPGDESATFGGLVATNAGGARAVKYGVIRNFIKGLEVVLPNGEIINIGGKIVKDSSGYSLLNLLIGSEGTLGIVTKIIINLLAPPAQISTLIVPYENMDDAIKTVPKLIHKGILPMAIEFVEDDAIKVTEDFLNKKWPCQGQAYLMIVVDGSGDEEIEKISESIAEVCLEHEAIDVFVVDNNKKQKEILDIRSNIYEALRAKTIELLDVVVPRVEIGNHVARVKELSEEYNMWLPTYGHAGDGNVHTHLMKAGIKDGKLDTEETKDWPDKYKEIREKIHLDAQKRGGKVSGEHGIGIVKKEYLPLVTCPAQIELMKQIKMIFDPNNVLNPGKIFDLKDD